MPGSYLLTNLLIEIAAHTKVAKVRKIVKKRTARSLYLSLDVNPLSVTLIELSELKTLGKPD